MSDEEELDAGAGAGADAGPVHVNDQKIFVGKRLHHTHRFLGHYSRSLCVHLPHVHEMVMSSYKPFYPRMNVQAI